PYAQDLRAHFQTEAFREADVRGQRRGYLGCVDFIDQQIGRVLDALERSDYRDNTIVILMSDNGFHLGEKERPAKRSLCQDGARVRLMIAGPGIAQGRTCGQPLQLRDRDNPQEMV
ncbi:MAG: sulfatase-like hydrolase/transferase, partial [Bdellovibrionaceae bacterium]|nr:sulfatase-like hydrolase/transferase [Pseudobdellovibrionaceae bacterium]